MQNLAFTSRVSSMDSKQFTPTKGYPRIANDKYAAALLRVRNVHTRFQQELVEITKEIGKQSSLSALTIQQCRQVSPCLNEIDESIRQIGVLNGQAGKLVQEGRTGLETSISSIQSTIESLQERNTEMQTILDISSQVSDSVNKIAEIAIENKLIAINASVTASKASDKVKGFKVIANEITRLSAMMADRVGYVVEYALKVGSRMQQIMQDMDISIQSAKKTLSSIDEAFELLDHVIATIGQANETNASMMSENGQLVSKIHNIEASIASIEKTIRETDSRTANIQNLMKSQETNLQLCLELLPELQKICDQLLEAPSTEEGPKHLVFAEMPVQTYDPIQTRMLREMHYMSFVGIRLLRYSTDKKLVPYLAETWVLQADGRTWEFRLKDGVRFHDGSLISTTDVKFSLERLMNPVLQSPYGGLLAIIEGSDQYLAGTAKTVSGIHIIDRLTLTITLKSTFNFFLGLLALSFTSIMKSDPTRFSRTLKRGELISAGPFRIIGSPDSDIDLLEANPDFLNGRPFIDSMEIRRNIPDTATGIIEKQLDLAYNVPALRLDQLKQGGFKGQTRFYTSRYCYGLLVNYRRDNIITRNEKLRQALVMSLDKDAIIRDYLRGNAVRADCVLPPETFDTGGKVFIKHDKAAATAIADSIHRPEETKRPLKLALRSYATLPTLPEIGKRIAESFRYLGIEVDISIHPATSAIADFTQDYDLVFLGFLSELDLYSAVEPFINPEGGDNYFAYHNPELVRLLESSITIKDNKARHEIFLEILEKLTLDVFMIPLFFQKVLCVSAPNVHSVFLSAEESFLPEVAYLSSSRDHQEPACNKAAPELVRAYSNAVTKLDNLTNTIVNASADLIAKGKDISQLIIGQKDSIDQTTRQFESFSASAEDVRRSRNEVVERIRQTALEAGKSSQAAQLIDTGVTELVNAIHGTLGTLNQVKKDIGTMLTIVRSISESNSVIGSVAINAAIISTKTDVRGGDLVKVSQSISEQAQRNTEYTDSSQKILDEMNKRVHDSIDVLMTLVRSLQNAASGINQSGKILEKVGPILNEGTERSHSIGQAAAKLESFINDALESVEKIHLEGQHLAMSAETLSFGLDMEQAVADILKDVSDINKDIMNFFVRTTMG